MSVPALAFAGVHVAVSARRLLHGVELAVPARGLTGIIGPNGSGKTSLLRTALGLLPCTAGRVHVAGRALADWPSRALARHVGYMAQQSSSHWDLSVGELLRLQGPAPSDALLERCDVAPLLRRRLATLSGGERARVGVARALAHGPALLLADEPAAHLDIPHHHRLMALLRASAQERAVVVVLHDLHAAALYCDRLVLMADGRVLAHGAPDEVLAPDRLTRAYGARLDMHAVGALRFFTDHGALEAAC